MTMIIVIMRTQTLRIYTSLYIYIYIYTLYLLVVIKFRLAISDETSKTKLNKIFPTKNPQNHKPSFLTLELYHLLFDIFQHI